jgi:hypothetical protein
MATALQSRLFGLPDTGPPRNDLEPVRTGWAYPAPKRYILRELSMKLDAGLQFFYKNPGFSQKVPVEGLAKVIAGILDPTAATPALIAGAVTTARAEETPLDLDIHGDPTFVFLRLDPTLNLRFDSDEAAVSLKDERVGDHYGGLRYVLEDGTVRAAPAVGCKLIYFAARPPALGPNGRYRHGFNFHVELVQRSPSATSRDTILPIIIDPDVGHPGGSQS